MPFRQFAATLLLSLFAGSAAAALPPLRMFFSLRGRVSRR